MKYSIKVIEEDNSTYYLSHKGKTQWCLRTAKKYAEDFWVNVGLLVIVEDQFGDCKTQFGW